jgi:hypothetical protein
MAVLWLKQIHPLSPANQSMDFRFRSEVQRILTSFASWPDSKYTVSWVDNLTQQLVLPEDCVVYFVDGYGVGVAKQFLDRNGSRLDSALQALVAPFNFTSLGVTVDIPGQPECVSEVHIGKVLHGLRQLRRHRSEFNPNEMTQYPVVLAAAAWHEAMHNKVDARMGPGWNLHNQGGGAWASQPVMSFLPNGGINLTLSALEPSSVNRLLMQQYFPQPVPQFVL